ncbi:MAG: hypothetical protein PHH70_01935 [Candidatus Gracilibacteria bacterium]|nr:hypothetical protein [Candidatus Gracilibacteria bacterium]
MEILMVIIVMVLGAYLITQSQTYKSEESSKTGNSGILSNIPGENDDNKNQEPPRFQMDQNLFTIDGLDRFFDSIIELLRTGKAWEWVKNWLQKSKIELPVFYIGIGIIFLIFAELIFILGILTIITYFSVKKIKAYRDKNPGFASFSSPVYTSQYSTYSANDFMTPAGSSDYPQMMKGLLIPVLKKVGKYLGHLLLFLIIVAYIVYKFFLPSDIQKQIETEVLTHGWVIHL